eukprot:CAMPEP_0173469840 /NCGR_PEP_ID=MMETSP1357-20121228/77567_1 /TAXON_ID=77926 /ORGANISM="Hemiselmis rufescens, Strain PCC563" /LENGTH=705 /DNA_ID=CAMNT_0014438095 /DNA_START=134 /DNA_END=2251 /DNA_ORIENTATION=+
MSADREARSNTRPPEIEAADPPEGANQGIQMRPRAWTDVSETSSFGERNPLDVLVLSMQAHTLMPKMELENLSKSGMLVKHLSRSALGLEWHTIVGSALYSSSPITRVVRLPWVHWLMIFVGLAMATLFASAAVSSSAIGVTAFSHYKFTALERRDGGVPTHPGITSFGLLTQKDPVFVPQQRQQFPSCVSHVHNASWRTEGPSMVLDLAHHGDHETHDEYRGFYIVTSGDGRGPDSDAVRFIVQGSDDGLEWADAYSSTSLVYKAWYLVLQNGTAEIPLERGVGVKFPVHLEFMLTVGYDYSYFAIYLGVLIDGIMGLLGRTSWVRRVYLASWATLALLQLGAAPSLVQSHPIDAMYLFVSGTAFGITGLGFWRREKSFDFFMAFSIVTEMIVHGLYGMLHGIPFTKSGQLMNWKIAAIIIITGCAVLRISRIRLFFWCNDVVRTNRKIYEPVWGEMQQKEEQQLSDLSMYIRSLKALMPRSRSRQVPWKDPQQGRGRSFKRRSLGSISFKLKPGRWSGEVAPSPNDSGWSGPRDPPGNQEASSRGNDRFGKGSTTLDVLQAQALLLEPLLLSLTVELAKIHSALLPLRDSEGDKPEGCSNRPLLLGPWEDEVGETGYVLGGVKIVARCVGKSDMCYKGDTSKLLDVCRQRLFFEQVDGITACLESLWKDPCVELVGIKSNLEPNDKGIGCMGLVKVNLKVQQA